MPAAHPPAPPSRLPAVLLVGAMVALTWIATRPLPPSAVVEPAPVTRAEDAGPPPLARLQWSGDAGPPPAALDLLAQAAQEARSTGRSLVIVPLYRPGDDPATVRRQGEAVRHAMEANGVAPAQLAVLPPAAGAPADQPGPHVELHWQ
ncbi:hypothetical protein OOT46_15225 [Aquabacterium sp. A7-Y]|uniref:hypothetical protein n=1 Tax=Aquabacterium sp. A7-Y TaxID=1349605 RepID=UPI00223CF03D|nr:hypothetical protein [Aquabacterium sp. A7-Y]MCW7539194.1 hypothetical protein [Aquabacterium sp. A7-Y]